MIAKLMSRKKSYERIMKLEDGVNSRSPSSLHPELTSKKTSDILLSGNRAGSHLSRAAASNSTRKQLQYYDSTPQQKRPAVLKNKQIIASSNGPNQTNLLDVTGQNLQKQHGKSSAYLPAQSSSMVELQ